MMATKLTITIPDELAERLEPWRDRMNISKVCAAAIHREVATLEKLPQEVQLITNLIKRLRREKAEHYQEGYPVGYERGIEYAIRYARYPEFLHFMEVEAELQRLPPDAHPDFELPVEALEQLAIDRQKSADQAKVIDPLAYKQGWLAGVMTVWRLIESKL